MIHDLWHFVYGKIEENEGFKMHSVFLPITIDIYRAGGIIVDAIGVFTRVSSLALRLYRYNGVYATESSDLWNTSKLVKVNSSKCIFDKARNSEHTTHYFDVFYD